MFIQCDTSSFFLWHFMARIYTFRKVSRFWLCFLVDVLSTVLKHCMHMYLHCFDLYLQILSAFTPWLEDHVQCLHPVGQNTFQSLPLASLKTRKQSQNHYIFANLEVLTSTCLGKKKKKEDVCSPKMMIYWGLKVKWLVCARNCTLLKKVSHLHLGWPECK